jgi:leucyl aminopeptidase
MKPGEIKTLAWPAGMAADALDVVCLPRAAKTEDFRAAGVSLQKYGRLLQLCY